MLYKLTNISYHYGKKVAALSNINLDIEIGKTTLISGTTGAGKSTLLNLLYGNIRPIKGQITFKGNNLNSIKGKKLRLLRQISGYINQSPLLVSYLSCYDNILLPLIMNGYKKEEAHNSCLEIMAEFGISYLRTVLPDEISLGEKKIVTICRALVHNPEFLLADEPTDNLDDSAKQIFMRYLNKLEKNNSSLILATNDQVLINNFLGADYVKLSDGRMI